MLLSWFVFGTHVLTLKWLVVPLKKLNKKLKALPSVASTHESQCNSTTHVNLSVAPSVCPQDCDAYRGHFSSRVSAVTGHSN